METNKNIQISLIAIFVLIETILCVLVQTTSGNLLVFVSFLAIVLSFVFSLITIKKNYNYILTSIGLLTTVCADIFLVVLNPIIQLPAMIFFSITQICYFIRIYLNQNDRKIRIIHLVVRILLVVIALIATIIVLKENTDLLSLISLFYYANLLVNVVFSFITNKKSLLFSIGLACFAMCDLFIGFSVLNDSYIELKEGTLLYFLANPGFNIAWIFYIPSQTLIALSNINFKTLKLNGLSTR